MAKELNLNTLQTCEFTKSEVLESEITTSQVSGKKYRVDEQIKSVVSGKTGHKQEFIFALRPIDHY